MGKSCCALGCSKRFLKGCAVHFYRFPRDCKRRSEWIAAVNRKNWEPTEQSWICSSHFVGGTKSDDSSSPAYVPTLFSHVKSPQKRKAEQNVVRYARVQKCKRKRIEAFEHDLEQQRQIETQNNQLVDHDDEQERRERCENDDSVIRGAAESLLELSREAGTTKTCSISTMTELTVEGITHLEESTSVCNTVTMDRLIKENALLKETNAALREDISTLTKAVVTPKSLMGDDAKVKYTGLPSYKVLKSIFDLLSPCISTHSRTALPLFNQFLMVLVRLRLNMEVQYLAYHFGIHTSNISRTFRKWVNVMYERLKPLFNWPGREELYRTMPMEFKRKFSKCVVIIDCFEIFMERPAALMARAQTWSNYKQHNTCKLLIGITPQGTISFISKAWGGRASDVHITENCGILENLISGDLILADRGFTIHDAAGLYCAEVKVPSFTKGKTQLSKYEVDTTRELAHVRIHVERVIGLLKSKYRFLKSIIPISLV